MELFKTDDFVHGLTISLIDNNSYDKLDVDIWIDYLLFGSFSVPHSFDIDDDHLGRNTSVFKIFFNPFKTTKTIKIKVKTELYNDLVTMKLLTRPTG
jgi:hypothetical protein